MRIGIDARFLGFNNSGLARYSEALLEALSVADTRNDYVVFLHSELKRKLRLGPNFEIVPVRGHPLGMQSMRRLARAVRRAAIDMLHVHYPMAPLWLDVPTLLTVHDIVPFKRESGFFTWSMPFARMIYAYAFYPMALRRARWILCVSRATRDAVSELFPDLYHKSIVVRSGVADYFRTPVEPATLELIRKRLSLPSAYVLYSGSIRADKNIDGALRVFAALRKRNPNMKDLLFILEITGQATDLELINKTIRLLGLKDAVRVMRDVNDEERRVLFADARALLNLSRSEGFGFPIIEAQLSNLPVVIADSGALPEIAGEQGAVLVDPDNEEQIVSHLDRVLTSDNLRAYLIENGRKNAETYGWPRTVSEMVQIYELLFYPHNQVDLPQRRNLSTRVIEWLPF